MITKEDALRIALVSFHFCARRAAASASGGSRYRLNNVGVSLPACDRGFRGHSKYKFSFPVEIRKFMKPTFAGIFEDLQPLSSAHAIAGIGVAKA